MEISKDAAEEKMTRHDILPLYKLLLLIKVSTGTKTEGEKGPGKDTEKRLSATFFGALNVDSCAPICPEQTDKHSPQQTHNSSKTG